MSQTIRSLERRLGVRLLHRTTRRVSLTDAAIRPLARRESAFQELDAATREIEDFKQKPSGTVRIVSPRIASVDHLQPILAGFHTAHPEVTLDITVIDSVTDIFAQGYDLGIRLGELLEEEVVAVRLGGPLRQLAVASPAYLAIHGAPSDRRRCISATAPTGVRKAHLPCTSGSLRRTARLPLCWPTTALKQKRTISLEEVLQSCLIDDTWPKHHACVVEEGSASGNCG